MDPLTPNDPVWNLLGKAKPVVVRPDFVANVVRQARQTPQRHSGWLRQLADLWSRLLITPPHLALAAAACAALLATATWLLLPSPPAHTAVAAVSPPDAGAPTSSPPSVLLATDTTEDFAMLPESDAQWAEIEQFDSLLVVQDASQFTDREIAMLLY